MSFCLVFVSVVSCRSKKFDLIEQKCGLCHSSEIVYLSRGISDWKRVLYAMKQRGLNITPAEEKKILKILNEIR
ncbi:hypothetical protein [Deferribacter abyssi]|uniref:hypothetical protein n=1 Tax=Deferribacter abyssi TaxID=213806 RepID=UPI003C1DC6AC